MPKELNGNDDITRDAALEELVADACESFILDENVIKTLQTIKTKDESLFGKIKEFFEKLFPIIPRLRKLYNGLANSRAGAEVKGWADGLERIRQAFAEGLAEASENFAYSVGLDYDNLGTNQGLHSERVTDEKILSFLNRQIENGEYVTTYKAMRMDDLNNQPIDNVEKAIKSGNYRLHSPMAALINGSFENEYELGKWYQAAEHPEMVKIDGKNGMAYFDLDKGKDENGKALGKVRARYNPYEHSSNYVINDQFKSAYKRNNLVVVEMRIPKSELTSGYKAEKAMSSVGWESWKKGVVGNALAQKGMERRVLLSRWAIPVRVLSNREVAQKYAELLDGTGISVPNNVVTPDLLKELEAVGVNIDYSGIASETLIHTNKKSLMAPEGAYGEVKHSTKGNGYYDYSKSFAEQIEDYKKGLFPSHDTLVVGKTPQVFVDIGLLPLPMTYGVAHLKEVLAGNVPDHDFTDKTLKMLPSSLEKPVAIFTSETNPQTSIVAILDLTHSGKPLFVAVAIDGYGKTNGKRIASNAILSVHKRSNAANLLSKAITKELNGTPSLFFWDKIKASRLLNGAGVQFPGGLSLSNGFVHSVHDNNGIVKTKYKTFFETPQFKHWFGKSKTTHKDGTPKVFYHQTHSDFTTFENNRAVAGKNDSETPDGYFFKTNDHDIGLEGKKQMAVYLKAENILSFKNREEANAWYCKNVPDYEALQKQMDSELDPISEKLKDIEDRMFSDEADNDSDLYDALDKEWNDELSVLRDKEQNYRGRLRKLLNDYFLNGNSEYDAIELEYDGHRWVDGERENVHTMIVFDPTQIKSAIDNIGTFDKNNPDIRYSIREKPAYANMAEMRSLKAENEKLRDDIEGLEQLLKLQKEVTGGKIATTKAAGLAAGEMAQKYGVTMNKQNRAELTNQMSAAFAGISSLDEGFTFEDVQEAISPVASWIAEHSSDVTLDLDKLGVEADATEKAEIAEFMKARLIGAVTQDVYDAYWRASRLETVADKYQRKMNVLYSEHLAAMDKLRKKKKESLAKQKAHYQEVTDRLRNDKKEQKQKLAEQKEYYRDMVSRLRKAKNERIEETKKHASEMRQKGIESRRKTQLREKIKRIAEDFRTKKTLYT